MHASTAGRYREIAMVLSKNGFEWLWSRWGVGKVFGAFEKHQDPRSTAEHSEPVRLRLTLEELGTTFIKLGQVLSTRPDLIPPEFIQELTKLQDDVPQVDYLEIEKAIVTEFEKLPEELFLTFDQTPRAAASIAQVHPATLPDGQQVVVKVRRPGIEIQVEQDLSILSHIARFLSSNSDLGKKLDLEGLVDEFAYSIRNELDFVKEGNNAERIATQFADDPVLHVPTIYWDFSTRAILTMDDVQGIKINDHVALDAAGIDRKELAKSCAHIALVQVLDNGFFHADPHPGNFFISPQGTVSLVDYGMVGTLPNPLRQSLVRLAIAVSRQDTGRLIDELLELGATSGTVNRQGLSRDLDHLLEQYDGLPLSEMSAGKIFNDIAAISQRHDLRLPSDLMVLIRVIAMDEGLGASLDPDFRLIEFSRPYFKRFWQKNHSVKSVSKQLQENAFELADIGLELPQRLLRLLNQIERGELRVASKVEVDHEWSKNIQQASNRISMSVLTAGLVLGLSILAMAYKPAGAVGLADIALKAMLVAAIAAGAWLLVSFWKSSR